MFVFGMKTFGVGMGLRLITCVQWRTFSVWFYGARVSATSKRMVPVVNTSQRLFCSSPWHKPLGAVPMPRRETANERTSEVIPIEDIVDKKSLACLEGIHAACSASDVFEALGDLTGSLTEVHVGRAFSKLADIHKKSFDQNDSAEEVTKSGSLAIRQDKEFIHLCHLALRHAPAMPSIMFLNVLKAALDYGLPQNSIMVQTLLASAEQRMNKFTPDNLALLADNLTRFNRNDQRVSALLQAVVLLVPDCIDSCTNAKTLTTFLRTVGKELDRHTLSQIATRLIAILYTTSSTDTRQTVRNTSVAIQAFCSLEYYHPQFLHEACQILLNYIEYLPHERLISTLEYLSDMRYHNANLLQTVGDFVSERVEEFRLHQLSSILSTYSSISQRYLHEKLLNSVAVSLSGKPLEDQSFRTLVEILHPFARFQYVSSSAVLKTDFFGAVAAAAEKKLETCPGIDLDCRRFVKLVALLAMCGSFSPRLTKTALSESFYTPALTDRKNLAYLRTLHNIIALDRPKPGAVGVGGDAQEDRPCDTDAAELSRTLDRLNQRGWDAAKKQPDQFKTSLANVLRDEVQNASSLCLDTDVEVANGYTVDFLVSDEKDGARLAIDLVRKTDFCANFPGRPLARLVIKERHLQLMGYRFCWIRRGMWKDLDSQEERAEYISGLIREQLKSSA